MQTVVTSVRVCPGPVAARAAILLAAVAALAGCSAQGEPKAEKAPQSRQRVAVQKPQLVRMDRNLELSGEFRAWQQADLHAKIAGYLRELNVDIGSRVRAGQTIAVLEVPELAAERTELNASLQRAESEELHATAGVNGARAQLRLAIAALDRLTAVNEKEKGLVAGQEIDEARARRAAAEANLASAEAAVQSARKSIEAARARVRRVEAMLDYTRIIAPFDGVITKRNVDPGSMVQAGTASSTQAVPVVQIAAINKLRLTIVVPESAVPDVEIGTMATVRIPALGQTFEARIARVTENIASASRTMEAQIDTPNSNGRISPGMLATVRLHTSGARDVLAIPLQAVSRRGGQAFVYTVSPNGKVDEKRIEAGLETASHVEIVQGLEPAERVIVSARALIQPGDIVDANQETAN